MRTLIIHPKDITTEFLKFFYSTIKDKTIITGGVDKKGIRELIQRHDRVIMLGHGTPLGLLSVGQFDGSSYVIDDSFSGLLSEKENNIYIWCHASEFMSYNQLNGVGSGMFISEIEEAHYFDYGDVDWDIIEESNRRFATIMSRYMHLPLDILFENVIHEYGKLAKTNPIAKFNFERLYFSLSDNVLQKETAPQN